MRDFYKNKIKNSNIKEKHLIELVNLIDLRSKVNRRMVKKVLKKCKCNYKVI